MLDSVSNTGGCAAFRAAANVYLRALVPDDALVLAKWFEDPSSASAFAPPGGRAAYLDEVARSERDVMLGICRTDSGRLVGLAGLYDHDPAGGSARLGILVGEPDERGKGLGTQATALLVDEGFSSTPDLERIWLEVRAGNARALGAYRKAGFERWEERCSPDVVAMVVRRERWRPAPTAGHRCA